MQVQVHVRHAYMHLCDAAMLAYMNTSSESASQNRKAEQRTSADDRWLRMTSMSREGTHAMCLNPKP